MKYLLDTNICIHFFRGKFDLSYKFEKIGMENCSISEITLAELVFGAEKISNPEKNHILNNEFLKWITVLPIYDSIYLYRKEKARLSSKGEIISDFDIFIACTAIKTS